MKDRDALLAAAGIADIHAEDCDFYDCMEEAAESRAIASHLRQMADAQPAATAGAMPGTDGFTMACFKAADVPVGTPLYTAPRSPAADAPAAKDAE